MAKLRKMLGDIKSEECINLMRLIETQSHETLSKWATDYAEKNYLGIFLEEFPEDDSLKSSIEACREFLKGEKKLKDIKPSLKAAVETARNVSDNPTAQAAARAVSTACAVVQTPTNSLGFLFYGAAAYAYHKLGLSDAAENYDKAAKEELQKAFDELKKVSVPNETNPAKINWNC